jgi:hypothetical protein
LGNRKLNWKLVDWQYWVIGFCAVGGLTFLLSGSGEFAEEMLGIAIIIGGIVLLIRRGILKIMKRR